MPASVLLGCQWGDEGKGKIVDLLGGGVDWVARYSGGPNAGHTVEIDNESFVLHLIPSGILRPGVRCVIGNGVVVDLDHLVTEISSLEKRGIDLAGRLFISSSAHVLLPYHRWLEDVHDQANRVGTTRRGIGPVYQDKMGRTGIRMHELRDRRHLCERLGEELSRVEAIHRAHHRRMPVSVERARERWSKRYAAIAEHLAPCITDTTDLLQKALEDGDRILCEGAQGTFLDIDHGTYPFVTSAPTTIGGALTGLGLAPKQIGRILGVAKAYTTRVGNGPFPTEFKEAFAGSFRKHAGEFGATTGRPRRCGWLDVVMLRQAVRLNGVSELCVTKLDILSGLPNLKVAVEYKLGRRSLEFPPADPQEWAACKPVFATVKGWKEDLSGVRRESDLPPAVLRYVDRISAWVGSPVRLLSVGSERDAVVRLSR